MPKTRQDACKDIQGLKPGNWCKGDFFRGNRSCALGYLARVNGCKSVEDVDYSVSNAYGFTAKELYDITHFNDLSTTTCKDIKNYICELVAN